MTRALRLGLALPIVTLALSPAPARADGAVALGGSMQSMVRQNEVARSEQFAFVRTTAQLNALVDDGVLERVESSADVQLLPYVRPFAQPEVKLLIQRLGAQYRAATGTPMVVTSLVRPTAEQPSNAHRLSVHPAGMALDLRVPAEPGARRWLENALLALERKGVLDVTREFRPPHYHVAVFPAAYRGYVDGQTRETAAPVAAPAPEPMIVAVAAPAAAAPEPAAEPAPVRTASIAAAAPLEAVGTGALAATALLGVVAIVQWRTGRRQALVASVGVPTAPGHG